jgi:biofilm PGA synthesis N-glycosyltransferase PgaC
MILLISSIFLGAFLFLFYTFYLLWMNSLRKQGANWKSKKLNAKISLIIPTYNEEATLPAKLENVLEQDYPKEQLELIIIDSGSTDTTPKIVREFVKKNPNMKVVFFQERERLGKSHAVNIAYSKASGEIKIISDSDALLEKSAITKIVSNFSDPAIGAASGRQVLLNAEQSPFTELEKSYRGFYEILRQGESVLDSTPIFHGELAAYRGKLIEPLPEGKSADDSRLANIIRRKGYRAVYDSSAVFYEYAPPNASSRFVQKVRRGQGLIRVFWDFRGCMFRRKYGAYGLLILPAEFLLHCLFPMLWLIFFVTFFLAMAFYNPLLLFFPPALLVGLWLLSRTRRNHRILKEARKISSLSVSFLSSQLILFYALILWISGRSLHRWQKVEDIRKEWRLDSGGEIQQCLR